MKSPILDRYIQKAVLSAIGLVALMLTGLQIFILFINQLDDLGKAEYGISKASVFVLLQLPYQVYLFFPICCLLGGLVGLGVLASHSELVVMRAAGMSIGQITQAVVKASLILTLLVTACGEIFVPHMTQYANDYKTAAITGGQTLRTANGVWFRMGNDFITVDEIISGYELKQIHQFHFDDTHHLLFARAIENALFENEHWIAYGVKQTDFGKDITKTFSYATLPWDIVIKPHILLISSIQPNEMTLHELNRYIREEKRNQVSAHAYKFDFMQRIMQPIATIVMMLLAIPFIFGPLRSSSMGSKLLVGATVGFGFYILNRFFGPMSLVFQWPPELAAVLPTVVFCIVGLYLMKKTK